MSADTEVLERTLETARAVADAVLYEGYLLYPYRASAAKNRLRWQFGVLVPPGYLDADPSEHSDCRTECLIELRAPNARLTAELRFLHVRERSGDGQEAWQEAEPETITVRALVLALDRPEERAIPFRVSGGRRTDPDGRTVRQWWPVEGVLRVTAEPVGGPYRALRLRVVAENRTPCPTPDAGRESALRHSLIAAHLLLTLEDGSFLSLTDPPEWARPAATACRNEHTWPVLIGPPDRPRVVLSSPIILEDYPRIAPESAGDLYDATEIDEILTLRTLALTDAEKDEARATDERAAAVIDRVETMPPELLERLHGAVRSLAPRGATGRSDDAPADVPSALRPATRPHASSRGGGEPAPWWDPGADTSVSPETDGAMLPTGATVARGSRVRLRPGARRSDAQDLFLIGRDATVQAVLFDVDGATHLAVTLDDDPAAELKDAYGRYLYFRTDEVEPLDEPPHEPLEGSP